MSGASLPAQIGQMARRSILGLLAIALTALARAHLEPPITTSVDPSAGEPANVPSSEVILPAETKPANFVYVAATQPDRIGRVMAPVYVNGVGPFAFVVATGASSSVIAPRVARRLALAIDTVNSKLLRGITGSEVVPTVLVDEITAGGIKLVRSSLPVVEPRVFADADGIFGADAFARGCLVVNFVRARHVRDSPTSKEGDKTSDYGRIKRQQRFLSSLLRKAMSGQVLFDPNKLSDFVGAFTKATMVRMETSASGGSFESLAGNIRYVNFRWEVTPEPWAAAASVIAMRSRSITNSSFPSGVSATIRGGICD